MTALDDLARALEPLLQQLWPTLRGAWTLPGTLEEWLARGAVLSILDAAIPFPPDADLVAAVDRLFQQAVTRVLRSAPTLQQALADYDVTIPRGPNPFQLRAVETYAYDRVRELTESARAGLRTAILRAADQGTPPAATARQLKGLIGLTERQTIAVQNFRRALESGQHGLALSRALRDRRHDKPLQRGATLRPDQIETQVGRYATRMQAYRAMVIARTESIRMLAMGQQAAWQTLVDLGKVPERAIRRLWVTAPLGDDRVCPECLAIPGMNPEEGNGFTELFQTPFGPLDLPPAHPMCRCVLVYAIR